MYVRCACDLAPIPHPTNGKVNRAYQKLPEMCESMASNARKSIWCQLNRRSVIKLILFVCVPLPPLSRRRPLESIWHFSCRATLSAPTRMSHVCVCEGESTWKITNKRIRSQSSWCSLFECYARFDWCKYQQTSCCEKHRQSLCMDSIDEAQGKLLLFYLLAVEVICLLTNWFVSVACTFNLWLSWTHTAHTHANCKQSSYWNRRMGKSDNFTISLLRFQCPTQN